MNPGNWVTSADQRAGLLVGVISSGRPELKLRTTSKYLESFKTFGADVVWVITENDVETYERDGHNFLGPNREHWYGPVGDDAYTLKPGSIKNPLRITNKTQYSKTTDHLTELINQ